LGIISSVFFKEELGQIELIPIPTAQIPIARIQQMIDLGIVFKASTIIETIDYFLKKNNVV
jgi:hypothetical protein